MRVIMDNGGAKTHTVNDKAQISHGIEQKTSLAKKSGGTLETRQTRSVDDSGKTVKPNTTRGSPSAAARKAEHFSKQAPRTNPRAENPASPRIADNKAAVPRESAAKAELLKGYKSRHTGKADIPDKPAVIGKRFLSPEAAARRQQKFKNKRLRLAPHKKYKVLENGVVNTGEITKRKARTIYAQKPVKLKKQKPKKISRQQGELISMAMGAGITTTAPKKHNFTKVVGGARKVTNVGKKPVEMLKQEFYKKAEQSDESGVKGAKLGMEIAEYGERGVKTAVETGVKTAKKGAKLTKRVYHKLHKTTSAEMRRKIRKQISRNKLKTQVDYLAKQAVKKGAKAASKAAANAAKKAAQAAYKAAQATAKAVAQAVAKVVSLIVETMPWSLIIIAAVLLILLIALMFGSMLSGASGAVGGGGAWLVDDNKDQTPEEIYEGYKKFVEQAKDVMENQAKKALENTVTSFCNSDTTDPRKIIEYHDKNNSRLFYPANGADATINALIEQFGTDDYADYMSLLFVLMTREKQQADGNSDDTIYDFDFTKEDFEEFMKTVNENSCRWGDTFVIKTAVEASPHACPNNCHRETRSGCQCCSSTDPETGRVTHYCGGHCPVDHTKMTVNLYTVKDYYGKDYPEIYNFTENEKTRYEASKAIIKGLLDYWEGQE